MELEMYWTRHPLNSL